jgi:hypothetical protein
MHQRYRLFIMHRFNAGFSPPLEWSIHRNFAGSHVDAVTQGGAQEIRARNGAGHRDARQPPLSVASSQTGLGE